MVVSSFAKRWFGSAATAFTTAWFSYAWTNFDLGGARGNVFIVVAVVILALAISFRRLYPGATQFQFKSAILLLCFPAGVPQMTYGIPLATTLYRYGVGGSVLGVILAVLVPMVPLAVFILMPFFEQISVNLEWSAQVLGASRAQIFRRILLPLMVPGILTAGLLILVNTISNFELAFLLGGGGSQTLVVAMFYNMFAGGVRPVYSIDAMAVRR